LCDADCIDPPDQCKQAHWNVNGFNFMSLYKLFDGGSEDGEEYVDLLAEPIVQLGASPREPLAPSSRGRALTPIRAGWGRDRR
jgi:starvation-inducible DNA-binding protein